MSAGVASWLLPWLVFLPLIGAGVTSLLPRARGVVSAALGVLNLVLTIALTVAVATEGTISLELAGWAPPVGIMLRLDAWSALFLAMTAVVGLVVTWYATGSAQARGTEGFWPVWLLLLAGLNGVYLTADLFNTYVTLELITVAAVGLVALGGRSSWSAALRYLFIAVLGSLMFLMAVGLVYAQTGSLHLPDIVGHGSPGIPLAATVLATAGLALKSALVPMHTWLPPAHAGAPTAVSPLMSALVIKASFYVAFRWWSATPGPELSAALGQAVGVLGVVAIIWGSVMAFRQDRLKRVVAYSTVAQVGYFFLVFPLLTSDAADAHRAAHGVVLFAIGHGLAKAAMFLATGALMHAHGSDDLRVLGGAVDRLPAPVFAFGIAGISLAGLPPTLAFIGKWELLQAGLSSGQWWWVIAVVAGGLLTAAYVGRALRLLMTSEEAHAADSDAEAPALTAIPARMIWAPVVLTVILVVVSFSALPLIDLLAMSPLPLGVGR